MKQYLVDELRPADHAKLDAYLKENLTAAGMPGIFWLELPEELLTAEQTAHTGCRPFYCAVNLRQDRIACELLVRSQQRLRCSCIGYADSAQRRWLLDVMDAIFEKLGVKT
jgi:hypothetical protein